jgi:phage terminase large subunit GpA-like protein
MVPREDVTHPPKKVGFHVNRLYSLLGRSGDIPKLVDSWIRALDDPKEKQGFINSALAEPWRQVIVTTSESEILKARCALPPQTVPREAVALTCFIDVQKRGRWFAVRAFARDFTSWLIHYGLLSGWDDVEDLLFATVYPVEGTDQTMPIWRAAIDTGGGDVEDGPSMTEETYLWLRKNSIGRGCRVWGTKGSSSPLAGKIHIGKALDKTPSGKPLPGGLQVILLDTLKLKDAFHYRLQLAAEGMPQGAYLHSETDQLYVSHITAEEKRRDKRGIEQWVQVRKRNDLLDRECGCLALADPEWSGGGVNLIRDSSASSNRKVRIVKSKWMGN